MRMFTLAVLAAAAALCAGAAAAAPPYPASPQGTATYQADDNALQNTTRASAGSDASKAQSVQGITGGKPVGVKAAAGDLADGADATEGAKADGACGTDTGTCSEIALLKRAIQRLTTVISTLGSPLQAGGAVSLTGSLPGYASTPTVNAAQSGTWALGNANNNIGDVGSATLTASCTTLTLPSGGGTYASGQLAANSATAGSVTPLSCVVARYSGGPVTITKARLLTSTTGAAGEFYVHLYTSSPTVTNGNGGTFLSTASGHFCRLDINLEVAFSDGADGSGVPLTGNACSRVLSATSTIYALIEARSAYAWTASQTVTVILEGYN